MCASSSFFILFALGVALFSLTKLNMSPCHSTHFLAYLSPPFPPLFFFLFFFYTRRRRILPAGSHKLHKRSQLITSHKPPRQKQQLPFSTNCNSTYIMFFLHSAQILIIVRQVKRKIVYSINLAEKRSRKIKIQPFQRPPPPQKIRIPGKRIRSVRHDAM